MKRDEAHTLRAVLAKALVFAMLVMAFVVVPVTTAQAATKAKLSKTSCNILEGKKYDLDVKNEVAGATYVWKTSNKKVAKVDQAGVVEAVGKGKATITCTVTIGKDTYKLTAKVSVIKPAKKIVIKNGVTALNVGQTYDLNRTIIPASSNDKTTWSSDNEKIAKPNKNGKFTAKKAGTVTITATTSSGKSASVKIKVVDAQGVVADQKMLDELLGSGCQLITIRTAEAVDLTIPYGDYSNQKLIVDAPKADVHNNGIFKSIEIKDIKADTWYEGAKGNKIEVTANKVRIIVSENASAGIEIKQVGSSIILINDGVVTELSVEAAANIEISGKSKEPVPVVTTVKDIKVTASVPMEVKTTQKISLVLNKGSEGTKVTTESKEAMPEISGTVTPTVVVAPKGGSEETVKQPSSTPAVGGPSGGSSSDTPSTPTTTTKTLDPSVSGSTVTYTLPVDLSLVKSVKVGYTGLGTLDIEPALLNNLRDFLSNKAATITKWRNTTNTVKSYAKVTGTSGEMVKRVEFTSFPLTDRVYMVTVIEGSNAVTVQRVGQSNVVTITMGTDGKTLTITNAPDTPSFTITY